MYTWILFCLHLFVGAIWLDAYGCVKTFDSTGTHFVLGVLGTKGDTNQYIQFLITSDNQSDISIKAPSVHLDISRTVINNILYQYHGTLSQLSNSTTHGAIEIISNMPISVNVIVGYGENNYEGFLVLPVPTLSTEYVVASYQPYGSMYSEFMVVGVNDITNVTVTLPDIYKGHEHSRMFNFQLNKMETYQYQGHLDLSGTVIKSDKPVAVFSGSSGSKIPVGVGDTQYLVEQMTPTRLWAYRFIIPPIYPRSGYIIRIFASIDNTTVNYSNSSRNTSVTIHSKKFYEFTQGKDATFITSDKPINVVQYGANFDQSAGDPFMLTGQAVSQFESRYLLQSQIMYATDHDTLVITIRSTAVQGLLLDGSKTKIQAATQIPVSHNIDSYVNVFINISYGQYYLITHENNELFGAVVYGLQDTTKAYGYQLPHSFTTIEDCHTPPNLTNTRPNVVTSTQVGGTVTYTCNTGYTMSGPQSIICLASGVWETPPVCIAGVVAQCFSCDDMTHLKYCDRVKACQSSDEVCYVQGYTISGDVKRYRSGCMSQSKCNTSTGHQGCTQCCSGAYCNTYGCGDTDLQTNTGRGPLCFDCKHSGEHDQCEIVNLCSSNQVCMVEKYNWGDDDTHFIMGCEDRQFCSNRRRSLDEPGESLSKARRNIPVCSTCCDSDFCNHNCTGESQSNIPIIG